MELKIDAFVTYASAKNDPVASSLIASPERREWMDRTTEKFAYRCTPMVVANGLGWVVLCPADVTVTWNGGQSVSSIQLEFEGQPSRNISSHFGFGVLTFNLHFLFRTPPGTVMIVNGPANAPKRGATALEGVVETDWLPFTFTMNWMMTEPNFPVKFARGEPICRVIPYPKDLVQNCVMEIRNIDSDPEFKTRYDAWVESRKNFHKEQRENPDPKRPSWQRHYLKGVDMAGKQHDHRNTAGTPEPADLR